jgi:hypothetical protein
MFCCLVSGCTISRDWEEEVKLHDGRVIVVERSVTRERLGGELGYAGDVISQKIEFNAGNDRIVWEDDITPIVFDVMNKVYWVAAAPMLRPKCVAHGNPNPPFIFYKYEERVWKNVQYLDFPDGLKKNLLVAFWRQKIDGKLTLYKKDQIDEVTPRDILSFNKNLNKACSLLGARSNGNWNTLALLTGRQR